MSDATEIAEALVEWARETVPELATGYSYDAPQKNGPLPDVAAEVTAEGLDRAGLFRWYPALQQLEGVWAYVCELSLLADLPEPDQPETQREAAYSLRSWATKLKAAIRADGTLGGRVQLTSRFFQIRYRPGYVEFPDGTRGREARIEMAVGELVT